VAGRVERRDVRLGVLDVHTVIAGRIVSRWVGALAARPLVVPLVAADNLEACLQRLRVDAHALDGARRRAHTVANLRALERGTGRAGRGEELFGIAQEQFSVGADVHDEPDFVLRGLVRLFGQDDAHVVRADMPGLDGEHMRLRAWREAQSELPSLYVHGIADRRREGRLAQLARRDVEQDVMHDAVADQHNVSDRGHRYVGLGRGLSRKLIQRGDNRVVQRCQSLGPVQVAIADPAHQVLAVGHLRVHLAHRREYLAGSQVAQVHCNARRADVYGQAVGLFSIAWLHAHSLAALPDRDRHFPVALAHDALQVVQQDRVEMHAGQIKALGQLIGDAVPIAKLMFQRRLLDLDIVQADGRINLDGAHGGSLTHHLLACLAFLGHEDHQVAVHFAGTG